MQPYFGPDAIANEFKELIKLWSTADLKIWLPDDPLSQTTDSIARADGAYPLTDALHRWYDANTDRTFSTVANLEITVYDADSVPLGTFTLDVYPAENTSYDLFFEDRSTISGFGFPGVAPNSDTTAPLIPESEEARETPTALVQPISAAEYSAIEVVIGHLHDLEASASLTEVDSIRLRAAIEILELTHRETEIDKTERFELWSATKVVLRFIYKDLPVDLTRWAAAVIVLQQAWPNLAAFLRSLGT